MTVVVRAISESVVVGENRRRSGHTSEYEQQQEAVGDAEEGMREVFITPDPMVAAAEQTQTDREGPYQVTED